MNFEIKKFFLKIILPFVLFISILLTIFSFGYDDNNKSIRSETGDTEISQDGNFYNIFQNPNKLSELTQLRNEFRKSIRDINLFYELFKNSSNSNFEDELDNKELQKKIIQLEIKNSLLEKNNSDFKNDKTKTNELTNSGEIEKKSQEENSSNTVENKNNKMILEAETLLNQLKNDNSEKDKTSKEVDELKNKFSESKKLIDILMNDNQLIKDKIFSSNEPNISESKEDK
ncbi:hypothetical protein ['Camptotheca acuminata' phytoplasma]|uniref:hypothetical protein n=1 Tax='Camptotheca acuminata' phytoplasma TaxID=3239192 RepID=UPI00351AA5FD